MRRRRSDKGKGHGPRVPGELDRALGCWRRFRESAPWRGIDGDAIFAIEDETSGQSYYASILGRARSVYGLGLWKGEEGLRAMGGLIEQELDQDQAVSTSTSLCISLSGGPLPDWYQEFLRESLGRKVSLRDLPLVYVNEGPRAPRGPRNEELRLLADTMDAVVSLVRKQALKPPIFAPGRPMPCVRLRSDGRFEVTDKTPGLPRAEIERCRLGPEERKAFRKLPVLPATDLVSCSIAPAIVQSRKLRLLGVIDAASDLVLAAEITELEDRKAILRLLFSLYGGQNKQRRIGLPREIQTDSRYFYETFKDCLAEIGISVTCFEQIPTLEGMRRSIAAFFGSR